MYPRERSKTNLPAIILGIVLGVGVVGGGIYYLNTSSSEQKPDNPQIVTVQQLQTQVNDLEQILNKPEHILRVDLKAQLAITKGVLKDSGNKLSQDELKTIGQELKQMQQELEPNNPPPSPPHEETLEELRIRATTEINNAIQSTNSLGWAKVKKTDLFNDWVKNISDATDKDEINYTLESALRDIKELRTAAPKERQKLKDYFVFCPNQELNLRWVDNNWNVRDMKSDLVTDLNMAIKTNSPQPSWQRKYMAFMGGFNINSQNDGQKFDNWVNSNPNLWIAIKKNHNSRQYRTERNTFYLEKGLADYQEFNTRRELATFLDSNDSYFRSN